MNPVPQELQELQEGMQHIQQQLQTLFQQKTELEHLTEVLTQLKKNPDKKEVLVPFGAGIFLKAELVDSQKVLLHVGANVTVEKSVPDTLQLIEKQSQELQLIEQSMQEEMAHIKQQVQYLQVSQMQQKE